MIKLYQHRPKIVKGIIYNKQDPNEIAEFIGKENVKLDNITNELAIVVARHKESGEPTVWVTLKDGDAIIRLADFTYNYLSKKDFNENYIEVVSE
jgi:hypothetical protein